ncbi:MAG: histidine phosphotransferase family protein [Roseinatronobacter sp.]
MTHDVAHNASGTTAQTPRRAAELGALIASRICHDLVSPIGAISNGMELLQLGQPDQSGELALISQSIESATTRLRFYRIAFGSVAASQSISRAEIASVLESLSKHARHHFTWVGPDSLSRQKVKLAALLLMCLEAALPWGGEIHVSVQDGVLTLTGRAERIKLEDDLWGSLDPAREMVPISSAKIQFAVARDEIAALRARIALEEQASQLRLTVGFA